MKLTSLFTRKKQQVPDAISRTATVRPSGGKALVYEVANLQGIGNRARQEDAFAFGNALDHEAISERGLLIAVADGMGGMQGGKIASETAVSSVLRSFQDFDMKKSIPDQLNNAVLEASGQVYEKLHEAGGSTMTVGLIFGEKLWFSSVGDSFLFLLRNRRLTRMNRSHNIRNRDYLDAILMGTIDAETAERDPERRAITQFLGMEELEEADFLRRPLKLEPGDVLLFCSDGVGEVLDEAELTQCLSHGDPGEMCEAMSREIKAKNLKLQDNYTALVVQCRRE